MFGFFKNKKPANALDKFIFALYGNPPPEKRADVEQAISLANELLMNVIGQPEVRRQAIALADGPVPYSTHDLSISVALHFFKQTEYVPRLFSAQLMARMKVVQWYKSGLVLPVLVKIFEDTLYELYKPEQ